MRHIVAASTARNLMTMPRRDGSPVFQVAAVTSRYVIRGVNYTRAKQLSPSGTLLC